MLDTELVGTVGKGLGRGWCEEGLGREETVVCHIKTNKHSHILQLICSSSALKNIIFWGNIVLKHSWKN